MILKAKDDNNWRSYFPQLSFSPASYQAGQSNWIIGLVVCGTNQWSHRLNLEDNRYLPPLNDHYFDLTLSIRDHCKLHYLKLSIVVILNSINSTISLEYLDVWRILDWDDDPFICITDAMINFYSLAAKACSSSDRYCGIKANYIDFNFNSSINSKIYYQSFRYCYWIKSIL